MTRLTARCLVLAVLVLAAADATAAFYLDPSIRIAVIDQDIEYRPDTGETFEQVAARADGWISNAQRPLRDVVGPVALWVRFTLPATQAPRRVMLTATFWETADFHVLVDGIRVDRQPAGMLLPWSERRTRVTMTPAFVGPFVEIEQPAGKATSVYARLATQAAYVPAPPLRFALTDAGRVREGELRDRIGQGIFLGVMLFLVVYNLGLFAMTREPAYAYYVLLETGFTVAWGALFGTNLEFLWPEHPHWDFTAMWMATLLGGTGLAQFLRHYLELNRHFPRIDQGLRAIAVVNVVLLPVVFLPISKFALFDLLNTSAPILVPVLLYIVFLAMRRRLPNAGNLAIALAFFGVGLATYAIAVASGNPQAAVHAGQIGSVLSGITLSLGLGWRHEKMREAHERERVAAIEEQNRTLEAKIQERTADLAMERERSDALLANILPQAVIAELRENGASEPRRHEETTILFTDFAGFTLAVGTMPAKRLVEELDDIFGAFDEVIAAHGLEKIKTIGDAYMAAGGLPTADPDHAVRCVAAALALVECIAARNRTATMKWGLRVGVHSGAVVAGVVGRRKYAYDVWGDTVNIASRLESAGEPGRVNVSAYTCDLVRHRFACEYRGKVAAKGKGEMDMYFVIGPAGAGLQRGNRET